MNQDIALLAELCRALRPMADDALRDRDYRRRAYADSAAIKSIAESMLRETCDKLDAYAVAIVQREREKLVASLHIVG